MMAYIYMCIQSQKYNLHNIWMMKITVANHDEPYGSLIDEGMH